MFSTIRFSITSITIIISVIISIIISSSSSTTTTIINITVVHDPLLIYSERQSLY